MVQDILDRFNKFVQEIEKIGNTGWRNKEVLVGTWKRLVMNILGNVDAKANMKKEE